MTGETAQTDMVYFDDVVVSSGYIGPIVTSVEDLNQESGFGVKVYPNPFTSATTIKYDVRKQGDVRIDVYNAMGDRVSTVVRENQDPGEHSVIFDADSHGTGIYYYTIQKDDLTDMGKMVLLR